MINKDQKVGEDTRKLTLAYEADAEGLGVINESGVMTALLSNFIDFQGFLKKRNKTIKPEKLVAKLSNGTRIIRATNPELELRKILYYAHLAACCEMFNGWQLPLQSIHRFGMIQQVHKALLPAGLTVDYIREISRRIHVSDAVRTINILRLLGQIKSSSKNIRQLSFAAGAGHRDLDGMHMTPSITQQSNILNAMATPASIKFAKRIDRPEHLILIDNGSCYEEHYTNLSRENQEWMLALNENADIAMKKLPAIMKKRNWNPVNFVVGIRVDHRMIADVKLFFSRLKPLLDDTADFIFSIGAGHTLDEFCGRKRLMTEMFDFFKQRGMSPLKIILHDGHTLEKQRNTPCFGLASFTTYEILYCKLKRKKL